jgi:hypothetical protein
MKVRPQDVVRLMENDKPPRDAERTICDIRQAHSHGCSWREGHHLSLNFVIRNGRLVSLHPTFFGREPA